MRTSRGTRRACPNKKKKKKKVTFFSRFKSTKSLYFYLLISMPNKAQYPFMLLPPLHIRTKTNRFGKKTF